MINYSNLKILTIFPIRLGNYSVNIGDILPSQITTYSIYGMTEDENEQASTTQYLNQTFQRVEMCIPKKALLLHNLQPEFLNI